MTATSVSTASIHVCLFKKALSSATDPKDTLGGAFHNSKRFFHLSKRPYSQLEISGEQSQCIYLLTTESDRKGEVQIGERRRTAFKDPNL